MAPMTPRHGSHDLVIVDLFAGGGGASLGMEMATGQSPAVAINHDPAAITMHATNHPGTLHLCEDVFDVKPFLPRGRSPDLLWMSPDCKHHSRAKGGKPLDKKIRALANIAIPWAREARPRIICLENVAEWLDWGPLYPADHPDESLRNKPIPERKGEYFRAWCRELEAEGYVIEWRRLVAADYGAPTTRKRLFLVARCDGLPIVWPEPTHGPGRPKPYRSAAECIDWSFPTLSLWATKEEQRAWMKATGSGRPRRPLAEATQARIAEGVRRYVLDAEDPYLVQLPEGLAAASLIHSDNGERKGQRPRTYDIRKPLGTVVACGQRQALVAAFLAKHNGKTTGQGLGGPLHTVTGRDTKALVAAHLTKFYGTSTGSDIRDPAPTTTAQGNHAGLVAALLCKYYGSDKHGQSIREPLHTIPTVDRFGLVTVHLDGEPWVITDIGMRMLQPRELARAQGFPDSYIITGNKKQQVARIGNSVSPQPARALAEAQLYGGPREGQLGLFVAAA